MMEVDREVKIYQVLNLLIFLYRGRMKVHNFDTKKINGRKRVSASILWENADRPEEEIYFEVNEQHQDAIRCNIDAFFLSTLIPALYYGEKRYVIDGEVCPALYDGIQEALGWIKHWYYQNRPSSIEMEVQTRSQPIAYTQDRNAAWFLSGGVDSYASFFKNRSFYSEHHPRYIKDGIVAYGLETKDPEKFEYVEETLEKVAKNLGVSLIPVYTNIYLIYRDDENLHDHKLWLFQFQGAVLAALAHILSNRINFLSVPSSSDYTQDCPFGTHPLLDPYYSSQGVQVYHDLYRYTRFEKTKIVAENFSPDLSLRVCNHANKYKSNQLNCGECEKCIRTMLGFLALGKLGEINAFPYHDVTKQMIVDHAVLTHEYDIKSFQDLVPALKKIGRDDLIEAIEFIIRRYKKEKIKSEIKSKIIDIDQSYFNGNIRQIKGTLRNRFRSNG